MFGVISLDGPSKIWFVSDIILCIQQNCKGTAKATPWTMPKASLFLISECSELATIIHKYSELNREKIRNWFFLENTGITRIPTALMMCWTMGFCLWPDPLHWEEAIRCHTEAVFGHAGCLALYFQAGTLYYDAPICFWEESPCCVCAEWWNNSCRIEGEEPLSREAQSYCRRGKDGFLEIRLTTDKKCSKYSSGKKKKEKESKVLRTSGLYLPTLLEYRCTVQEYGVLCNILWSPFPFRRRMFSW